MAKAAKLATGYLKPEAGDAVKVALLGEGLNGDGTPATAPVSRTTRSDTVVIMHGLPTSGEKQKNNALGT